MLPMLPIHVHLGRWHAVHGGGTATILVRILRSGLRPLRLRLARFLLYAQLLVLLQ
jgi:hypothetical protein